ncbi:MAG: GTPase HflX [Candidatus Absconditabacterales bacterium]|nr:GTPase HflX [Candidatus Absconditabacterales bacterium]
MRACTILILDPQTTATYHMALMHELRDLISTVGGISIIEEFQKKSQPDYQTYVGSGKLDEIMDHMDQHEIDLLIIGNLLKPGQTAAIQQRLDKRFGKGKKIAWDKIDLILAIFEKHAQTTESKLQIELAKLTHLGTRIAGTGMDLSRQGGGSKLARGAGETNSEVMRRHVKEHKRRIIKQLEKYAIMRQSQRARRKKNNQWSIGVVGYTNAGKSSLISMLGNKKVYVANKLFATLGTQASIIHLGSQESGESDTVIIHDTIGFIRDLPPQLLSAFRSTLEDSIETDLIIHALDGGDPEREIKLGIVEKILADINSTANQIYVITKIDTITPEQRAALLAYPRQKPVFWVNNHTSEGKSELIQWIKDWKGNNNRISPKDNTEAQNQ